MTPRETRTCLHVTGFTIGDNGERNDTFCGSVFPDNDEGPHNIYMDLCGPCYEEFKSGELDSSAPEVTKQIRITLDERLGIYTRFSDGNNRIALDDCSLDITVDEDDYFDCWSSKLRFVICFKAGCKGAATHECSNEDCDEWYCSSHIPNDEHGCANCDFFQTSPSPTRRTPLVGVAFGASSDSSDRLGQTPLQLDSESETPNGIPLVTPASISEFDNDFGEQGAATSDTAGADLGERGAATSNTAGADLGERGAASSGTAGADLGKQGDSVNGLSGKNLSRCLDSAKTPIGSPNSSSSNMEEENDGSVISTEDFVALMSHFGSFTGGQKKPISLWGEAMVHEMLDLNCDIEKNVVKTKYFVDIKKYGKPDIMVLNKWIMIDAYCSISSKKILLLAGSIVICRRSHRVFYLHRMARTKCINPNLAMFMVDIYTGEFVARLNVEKTMYDTVLDLNSIDDPTCLIAGPMIKEMDAWMETKKYIPSKGCNRDETGKPVMTKEYVDYMEKSLGGEMGTAEARKHYEEKCSRYADALGLLKTRGRGRNNKRKPTSPAGDSTLPSSGLVGSLNKRRRNTPNYAEYDDYEYDRDDSAFHDYYGGESGSSSRKGSSSSLKCSNGSGTISGNGVSSSTSGNSGSSPLSDSNSLGPNVGDFNSLIEAMGAQMSAQMSAQMTAFSSRMECWTEKITTGHSMLDNRLTTLSLMSLTALSLRVKSASACWSRSCHWPRLHNKLIVMYLLPHLFFL